MALSRQRNTPVRLFLRRLSTVALAIIVILAAASVWNVYQKERESRELRNEASMQLSDLKAQSAKLQTDVTSLETERGQEAALRQAYAMGKEGEQMIVIVNPDAQKPIATTTSGFSAFIHKWFSWW